MFKTMKYALLALFVSGLVSCFNTQTAGASGIGNPQINVAIGLSTSTSSSAARTIGLAPTAYSIQDSSGLEFNLQKISLRISTLNFENQVVSLDQTVDSIVADLIAQTTNPSINITNYPTTTIREIELYLNNPSDTSFTTLDMLGQYTDNNQASAYIHFRLNLSEKIEFHNTNGMLLDTCTGRIILNILPAKLLQNVNLRQCLASHTLPIDRDSNQIISNRADLIPPSGPCAGLANSIIANFAQSGNDFDDRK